MDECFTPDTEILTSRGFVAFKDLNRTELIAQYTDEGCIEFVKPIRYVNKHYSGQIIEWQPRRGHKIRMTPNHQQPLYYNKSKQIRSSSICDIKFNQNQNIIVSGKGSGYKENLTTLDRLAIICQADGSMMFEMDTYNRWMVGFKKQRKIERFLDIINSSGIVYNELKTKRDGYRRFSFNLPKNITKKFDTYFNLDMSYECAREFIDEVKNWDGSVTSEYIYYSSILKDNTDFVSAVGTLGGYSAKQKECLDDRSESFNNTYRLWLYDRTMRNCAHLAKYKEEVFYDGEVCCVEVPSHKIIVRADGFTFVSGNCQMITLQGWSAFLKVLEEPPPYVIFMLATTDPQKLLPTILSRVQRFNFTRISVDGIRNRLLYILQQEDIHTFEYNGIDYIARLADGGMRAAITLLEECLDYSTELTLDNILKVTSGGLDEVNMLNMLELICIKDSVKVLQLFTKIYNSGVDISVFIKMFTEYLVNCVKYLLTRDVNITILSEKSVLWLNNNLNRLMQIKKILFSISTINNRYSSGNLKVEIESWLVEVCE